jgi:hypothetical protein
MWSYWTGQKVVCIHDKWDTTRSDFQLTTRPTFNNIYTIRQIHPSKYPNEVTFTLVEIVNPPLKYDNGIGEILFRSIHFHPLKDTKSDISLFNEIKDNPKFKIKDPLRIKEPT